MTPSKFRPVFNEAYIRGKELWPILLLCWLLAFVILTGVSLRPASSSAEELKTFATYDELAQYIKIGNERAGQFGLGELYGQRIGSRTEAILLSAMPAKQAMSDESVKNDNKAKAPGDDNQDFSETNNQVQGVDEADLVKTDGGYIYLVSNGKVFIMQAYPAQDAKKLTEIKFEGYPKELFIYGDSLVVFGSCFDGQKMFIRKYDIADRKSPSLLQEVTCDGYYVTSRMIGENVYTVINAPVYFYEEDKAGRQEKISLPVITNNDLKKAVQPTEIYYFDRTDNSYRYSMVLSVSMKKAVTSLQSKTYLTGTSQNIFVSDSNIYLTGNKSPDYEFYGEKLYRGMLTIMPEDVQNKMKEIEALASLNSYAERLQKLEEIVDEYLKGLEYGQAADMEEKIRRIADSYRRDIERDNNKTVIYKLAVADGQVAYKSKGEVDGFVLNQFSMDEHSGYFRIATTSEGNWSITGERTVPKNNIFVLDDNMQVTGKLVGLAPNERIFSARFMGDRVYMVTFRQTDPLFVIDLKEPTNPRVLGELKIPGYSDYLHPYDENHLIGIGKEVAVMPEAEPVPGQMRVMPPPTREKGVKIALFDVTNPSKPKEMAKYVVESDNSDSPALHDHRAVLFSKEKKLLVLPISERPPYRIMEDLNKKMLSYSEQGWQGAYVFNLSMEQGINLKGKVEHQAEVRRTLYIGNVLYSVSDNVVKLNNLDNLKELNKIDIK